MTASTIGRAVPTRPIAEPQSFAALQRALVFAMLLPRNACVFILRVYRATISPLYGDVCRYYPSCSAYTLGAIQQHGVVKGVGLGAWRIARCHPWAKGGVDDVPARRETSRAWARYRITRFGFVLPASPGKA